MRSILAILLACLLVPTIAVAQFAPTFSQGPTIPMFSVRFDEGNKGHASFLTEGAGYSFNFNFAPSADGRWRYLTLGIPVFMRVPADDQFAMSAGATIGTLNNLVSFGAAIDLADLGETQSGLFTGTVTKQNVALLIAFNINFGSGTQPSSASKVAAPAKPPPNYYCFWK